MPLTSWIWKKEEFWLIYGITYGKSLINWKIPIFKQDLFWNANKLCGATLKCKCVLIEKKLL